MTEKKEKPATEAKAAKKAPAPKAEAKSAAPKPAARKEVGSEKKAAPKSGGTITVVQTGSPIGRQGYQRATLIGLGLNKMHRRRVLMDTPSVRGMVEKVKHLVRIVE